MDTGARVLIVGVRMQALSLMFVAVYQKALKLTYVDALLEEVKQVVVTPLLPHLNRPASPALGLANLGLWQSL